MFLANKLNKGAGSPAPALDAQFNYVTMLLHGDGTNGAQNNTFLDSGPNTVTITRNGNTTQGSFSPYGSNWSNYFNGTNAYLTPPTSSVVLGSSDFTVEYWLFASNNNSHLNSASTAGGTFTFLLSSNAAFYWGNGSAWEDNIPFTSGTLAQNTWHHIAMTRQSSTMRLFLNGVLQGSATVSVSIPSNYWQLGAQTRNSVYLDGYLSNFRIVSGTALYTSNFTPSTTPLTAVSGTSLLTCQSNRFIDNSTNNFAITVNGTPSVQRFNPFGASTAYDTSVIGGSGYFDGTGDYLSVPTGTALNLSTGDFTIEGWMYATDVIGYHTIFSNGDYPSTAQVILVVAAAPSLYMSNGSGWVITLSSSINVNINSWNHIAVTASGTTYTIWVNGVSGGSSTASFTRTTPASTSVVGRLYVSTDDYYAKGYTTNVRVVKGTALYTTTFTPPTAPLTAVTNTQLLLNTTNGAIFDNAMMNSLETVGNAQISTSVVKYGTGSIAFDGTGDYLKIPYSPNLQFGTGAYTFEFWLNTSSVSQWLVFNAETDTGIRFYVQSNGTLELDEQVANVDHNIYSTATVNDGAWHHIALSRASGAGTKMFVDGVYQSQQAAVYNFSNASPYYIGTRSNLSGFLTGYIDDMRITKGFARYTANFTPPTQAFPNIGPV